MIGLNLTVERLRWPFQELMQQHGDLTSQQYNVLRILRGAGAQGLPTLEIGDRMVERTPGISRMIDRLERKGLVARTRAAEDRRQVLVTITDDGSALLKSLDRPIDKLTERVMGVLSETETRELVRLLDKLRNGLD